MKRFASCALLLPLLACGRDERPVKALAVPEPPKAVAQTVQPTVAPPAKGSGALTGKTTDDRPKSLVGTIRGRAARLERVKEMRTIAQYYAAMATPPATAEQLMEELKIQARPVYDAMKDGYYVVNPRALKRVVPSDGIIAYEVEPDTNGWYVVRGDASVDAIPPDQLKAALAK